MYSRNKKEDQEYHYLSFSDQEVQGLQEESKSYTHDGITLKGRNDIHRPLSLYFYYLGQNRIITGEPNTFYKDLPRGISVKGKSIEWDETKPVDDKTREPLAETFVNQALGDQAYDQLHKAYRQFLNGMADHAVMGSLNHSSALLSPDVASRDEIWCYPEILTRDLYRETKEDPIHFRIVQNFHIKTINSNNEQITIAQLPGCLVYEYTIAENSEGFRLDDGYPKFSNSVLKALCLAEPHTVYLSQAALDLAKTEERLREVFKGNVSDPGYLGNAHYQLSELSRLLMDPGHENEIKAIQDSLEALIKLKEMDDQIVSMHQENPGVAQALKDVKSKVMQGITDKTPSNKILLETMEKLLALVGDIEGYHQAKAEDQQEASLRATMLNLSVSLQDFEKFRKKHLSEYPALSRAISHLLNVVAQVVGLVSKKKASAIGRKSQTLFRKADISEKMKGVSERAKEIIKPGKKR